jgi:hypothetical protein
MPCASLDQLAPHRTTLFVTEEPTWGTYDAGQDPLGIEYAAETFKNEIKYSDGRRYIGDGRAAEPGRAGRHDPGGAIDGEWQPHGFWALMTRYALGDPVQTSGPSSGVYAHILEGRDALPTSGLTFERVAEHRSGTRRRFRYEGCKVESLYMRIATGAAVQARVVLVGREESNPGGDPPPATYPLYNEPFIGREASILLDTGDGADTAVHISSLEFTIANALGTTKYSPEDGAHRSGIPAGGRTITGAMRAMFTDSAYAAYLAGRGNTDGSLAASLVKDSVSGEQYRAQFTFPKIRFRMLAPQNTGKGPITADIRFVAHKDSVAGTDVQALLINRDPTLTT